MAMVVYAIGVWIVLSVPLAFFVGAVCRLNQLSKDEGALLNPDTCAQRDTLGAARDSRRRVSGRACAIA